MGHGRDRNSDVHAQVDRPRPDVGTECRAVLCAEENIRTARRQGHQQAVT